MACFLCRDIADKKIDSPDGNYTCPCGAKYHFNPEKGKWLPVKKEEPAGENINTWAVH